MTRFYRVVNFSPDPIQGLSVPVAAVVRDKVGTQVLLSPLVPSAKCLGGVGPSATLEMIRESILAMADISTLPPAVGPHASLGELQQIPATVTDAVEWVQRVILPATAPTRKDGRKNRISRVAASNKFLEQYDVARWVQGRYRPRQERYPTVHALPPISQHAGTEEGELLLLEPVRLPSTNIDKEVVDKEVVKINTRFSAYRFHASSSPWSEVANRAQFFSYILPGGQREDRIRAMAVLEKSANEVFDTNDTQRRRAFLERIEEAGRAAELALC